MTSTTARWAGRIGGTIKHWFCSRIQECFRCAECDHAVTPWETHCPTCGQENPARVSASAPVFLVLASVLLVAILSFLISAF